MNKEIQKCPPQKPEDFIGWKSEDGKLEVVGVADETGKEGRKLFKVTCTECSKDPELFPLGYFVSTKSSLLDGSIPCGCSAHPYRTKEQYLIITSRAAQEKGFTVHGFTEEFHGYETKIEIECKRGHKWITPIKLARKSSSVCPDCTKRRRLTSSSALSKCESICKDMNYKVIGFVDGYKNQKSRFKYVCPKHDVQNVGYNDFINKNTRCPCCWKEKQKELGNANGYYEKRKDDQDFLYVLDFNGEFVKVGRGFDLNVRIDGLQWSSWIDNINVLRVFTATHKEVYNFEQNMLSNLRQKGFQYSTDWSYECFCNESLGTIREILDSIDEKFIELYENINPETKKSLDDDDKP